MQKEHARCIFLHLMEKFREKISSALSFHGMSQTNQDWVWRGHVQEVADRLIYSQEAREMIIVMPDAGGDIYKEIWNGFFNMPGWLYEDFFLKNSCLM